VRLSVPEGKPEIPIRLRTEVTSAASINLQPQAANPHLPRPYTPAHFGPDVAWSHYAPLPYTVLYTAVNTLAGTEVTTLQSTLTLKRGTFPRDYKIPRTNRIFLRTATTTAVKTVCSARSEISKFHLAQPKHHSAWLLSSRPNVLSVPDQVWFLSVLARIKLDQFTVLTVVSFTRFFQCRNVNNPCII
jgi:hypothetical protein